VGNAKTDKELLDKIHQKACDRQQAFYVDPNSKLLVQTAYQHHKRGYCCESGCRHCPYNHQGKKKKE